jgi:excisionase family DNA binding protein
VGKKRTEITIETERILLISRRNGNCFLWCERCGQTFPMLTVEEAAAVLRVSRDELLRKLEDRQLHCVQTPAGFIRICPNSLMR